MFQSMSSAEMSNFGPRDGLICYEGPTDAQTALYNKVRASPMQFIFAESELHKGSCESRGFGKSIGGTCYGDTFINTWNLKPHTDDEAYSYKRFVEQFGKAAVDAA